MSLSIREAIEIGKSFQNINLMDEIPNKGKRFNKARIKALSQSDRKLCTLALSRIKSAQFCDVRYVKNENTFELSERSAKVIDAISRDLPPVDHQNHQLLLRPILWIAKRIYACILGIMNTLFGRISSEKLWNKVEVYLHDVRKARHDVKELTRVDTGLIAKAKESLIKKVENQRKSLEEFQILYRYICKMRFSQLESNHLFNLDAWFKKNHPDSHQSLEFKVDLKEIFKLQISVASSNIQKYCRETFQQALSENIDKKTFISRFNEELENKQEEFSRFKEICYIQKEKVIEAKTKVKQLEERSALLKKKYLKENAK